MFDKAKLQALDMPTLSALRDAINDVLHAKMRFAAYTGFEVLVRDGGVRMRVTGYRQKNLTGYVISPDGTHMPRSKYRAHPLLATVVSEGSKPTKLTAPLRTGRDLPGTVPASAF